MKYTRWTVLAAFLAGMLLPLVVGYALLLRAQQSIDQRQLAKFLQEFDK